MNPPPQFKLGIVTTPTLQNPLKAAITPLLVPEGEIKFRDEDLEFVEELGHGAGGSVAKVVHIPSGAIMARKYLSVNVDAEQERKKAERNLKNELKILHKCRSEYIVSSFGAYISDGGVNVVMEYMDLGSLDSVYKQFGAVPEEIVVKVAVRTLKGLVYLQKMNIVHRDIKPSNLLLNSAGQIKIADFGVSKELVNTQARTFTGTQGYLAPERIDSGQIYGVVSDIWSLGLTLMEIATAVFPYAEAGESVFDLITFIKEKEAPRLPPGRFSEGFEGLVGLCLIKDHMERPAPDVLLQHPSCVAAEADGCDVVEWAKGLLAQLEK
ncbi:mitogen-activated protein kinase [Rhizoclosmatium globosum]|uniref:mitogen-activated protein kinase kinase n=1 Tax=Rhizoclosmatium globosum TaxID=329046 RepID=A0A1Y2BXU3_9FUNG|nr:mitogen-activated protein kinase [Rhizoclosmatium globosum]|eukprot:ORY39589.1 mitogen-activated protein kinase [Rhizoclosmatium globosum]